MATHKIPSIERVIFLALTLGMAVSCVIFLVLFELETARLNEFNERYSVAIDVVRQRLPGLHLITVPLFFALLFAKRYVISFLFTVFYAASMFYSYSLRLDGSGYFGGQGFYDDKPFTEIVNKSHLFEFAAVVFILFIGLWQISVFVRLSRHH